VLASSIVVIAPGSRGASAATQSARTCTLPPLSKAGVGALAGPAAADLRGSAVRHGFTLDGGDLVVGPPRSTDRPTVPADYAECNALASSDAGNAPLGGFAGSGVAVGFGRVTIAGHLFDPVRRLVAFAKQPPIEPYSDRLAWVVVFRIDELINCPLERASAHIVAPPASDYDYQVFLVDAHSGGDALVYDESQANPCGGATRIPARLDVPSEQVSVPWSLVSRDPDGYSGTIVVTVQQCETYDTEVWVDRDTPTVQVLVSRPVGGRCGRSFEVTMTLRAAVVTGDLPAIIRHAPVGLDLGGAPGGQPGSGPVPPPATAVPLIALDAGSDGRTYDVDVGDVLTVNQLAEPGVASTDPAVLGGLSPIQPIVAEFRAWEAGEATLISGAWRVQVVVAPHEGQSGGLNSS
jgi:hypothetical protein